MHIKSGGNSAGKRTYLQLTKCYLLVVLLSHLAAAACGSKANSILSTMKSKSFTRFCTQMLPITTSTKTITSQYTSTVTYSLTTTFATVNATTTFTNWVFDITGIGTVTSTQTVATITPEAKRKRATTSTSVSTPPILKTYPPAQLTAACSCWSLPAPSSTSTFYAAPTTVTRNATTTYTLSRPVRTVTVSSTSHFAGTITKTVTATPSPSTLGSCKPYKLQGARVFSSGANSSLFSPDSFVAYALQGTGDAVLSTVAVNSTDSNNKTIPLIFDYSSYRATGDTTVISPDGTNFIIHSNGSLTGFGGPGCTKPVTWNPSSASRRRDTSHQLIKRASPKYVITPSFDVSISIKDRCFQPVNGDSSWRMYCGIDYIDGLGLLPWIEVALQPDAQNKALVRGTCPSRNVTDQSQTSACGKVAAQLRDACNVYSDAGMVLGPQEYKKEACMSVAQQAQQFGPQAGSVVGIICSATFVASTLFCSGLKFKQDNYCTPLPDSLGLKVMAGGLFGTVPLVQIEWQQGTPGPAPLALQGTIDVPWDSRCRNTYGCDCHCYDQQYVYTNWSQTYSGRNVPKQLLDPTYRQNVFRVTNSSAQAGLAECLRLIDSAEFAGYQATVAWHNYVHFDSTQTGTGAGYWGSTCILPKLESLGPDDMIYDLNSVYYDTSQYTGTSLQQVFVREKRKVCVPRAQCVQVICAA